MEQVKSLNVAIVGGGPGCKAIMDMIFAEKLSQLRMELVGVACTNPKAVGYRYAQEKGIYTTRDYRDLYKLKDLNMIIELTGRLEVAKEIYRTKPHHVRLMDHVSARLFWDIFQIEEERIAEREQAEGALRESIDRLQVAHDQSIIYAQQLSEEIAERKRTEEVLRESEQKYRALFEESPISLWEEDFSNVKSYIDSLRDGGTKDLREHFESHPEEVVKCAAMVKIVDVNKRTLELYKAGSKEQFLGSLDRVFREESYDMFREELIAIAEGRTAFEEEMITQSMTGDSIHVAVRFSVAPGYEGTLSKVIVSVMDLTERKRAEDALRQSEAEKKAILDASVDSIRLVDKDMRIRWANETTTGKFDISPEDILGETCHKILADRDTPCEGCPSKKAIETGKIERSVLCVPNAPGIEGETYWDCYGVPLKDESGETIRLIQIARDVTGQVEAERELRKRHHALKAINEILFRVTKEYNLNGMGDVLQNTMEELYTQVDTLAFLLTPQRDGFYFPRPERGQVKETCYDRARKKIQTPGLEHDLLELLTTQRMLPTCFGSTVECSALLHDLAAGFNSWLTVPIEVEDVCYGLFMLGSPSADIWEEHDVVFVEALIRQISGVIRYQISKEMREEAFRSQLTGPDKFMGIVGRSEAMQGVYELIQAVADSESTVLITGESGTGKELVAQAIHQSGRYKDTPFIAAHCSSFVPTLVQSELFGHEKGAFTGATSRKLGRLERANGGILFLDEVAELPLETQVLLLRFLQDKSFERVGGEGRVQVAVRIIAATNRRIEKAVKAGRLRKDFYYRLSVIHMHVPSLRERSIDVPLLADHFLRTHCLVEGKEITGFDTEAMQLMMDYDWPGNVRELQNTVARCVVLSSNRRIGVEELPEKMRTRPATPRGYSLAENERNLIVRAMSECKWNKHEAARLLEISRATLYSKLKKFNIQP